MVKEMSYLDRVKLMAEKLSKRRPEDMRVVIEDEYHRARLVCAQIQGDTTALALIVIEKTSKEEMGEKAEVYKKKFLDSMQDNIDLPKLPEKPMEELQTILLTAENMDWCNEEDIRKLNGYCGNFKNLRSIYEEVD